jgi:hypothetical protein
VRKHRDYNFIYIGLVEGETLRGAWLKMTAEDKESILEGLQAQLPPSDIENIYRDKLPDTRDTVFTDGNLTLSNILVACPPGVKGV